MRPGASPWLHCWAERAKRSRQPSVHHETGLASDKVDRLVRELGSTCQSGQNVGQKSSMRSSAGATCRPCIPLAPALTRSSPARGSPPCLQAIRLRPVTSPRLRRAWTQEGIQAALRQLPGGSAADRARADCHAGIQATAYARLGGGRSVLASIAFLNPTPIAREACLAAGTRVLDTATNTTHLPSLRCALPGSE